jgi:uracil-xanthine permease
MSGVATIIFLLIVQGKVPSYLGTSAAFVGGVAAIYAQDGNTAQVTGSIMIAGIVLAIVGVIIHFAGSRVIYSVLPPVVTGAVVMLIGFNLAPVVAGIYWPQDQWIALVTAVFMVCAAVMLPGFWSRIAVFLALIFGYVLSWLADLLFGTIHSITGATAATGEKLDHDRVSWAGVKAADLIGLPSGKLTDGDSVVHGPSFNLTFILLVLPGVIALIAENTGHVKAVAEMTKTDLDPYMGKALAADGFATALSSAFGGSPTTTYAENIGVMGATKVYSTAAYYVAAVVAILLGLCPKFGAIVSATPGGVLGGITVVLYGMIGLVGAKIWVENGVDFGDPVNMVGLAGGLIAGIGGVSLTFGDNFELSGIALGTIMVIVFFHLVNGRGSATSGYTTQALSHPDVDPDPGSTGTHRSDPSQAFGDARSVGLPPAAGPPARAGGPRGRSGGEGARGRPEPRAPVVDAAGGAQHAGRHQRPARARPGVGRR